MAGRTQSILALEEAQASIRAARFGPDLTSTERFTLMRDGIMRLQKAPGGAIMKNNVNSLDQAVQDFVASLSKDDKGVLADLFINSHASWSWYEAVINRFNLRDEANPIIHEIDERFPDESALKFTESDFNGPIFEAGIFLREAKKFVLAEG